MAWEFLSVIQNKSLASYTGDTVNPNQRYIDPAVITSGNNPLTIPIDSSNVQGRHTWKLCKNYTIVVEISGSRSSMTSTLADGGSFYAGHSMAGLDCGFLVDHETHRASACIVNYYRSSAGNNPWASWDGIEASQSAQEQLYTIVMSNPSFSAGAGSGYIGNSLLTGNKFMAGYNVPTSDVASTKTISVNDVSASAVSGKPKSGNGFARIKFLYNPYRSISKPLPGNIKVAKFAEGYEYYYGRQEVPTGQQYYDITDATPITLTRGGSQSFGFGNLPAVFGIYDPNSSNVVNWYLRKTNSSGASMLVGGANTGSFSADGNYTFYIIAGGEPSDLENGKGYFTVIRTTDWSNGYGGLGFSNDILQQLKDYFL